jgi:hypothetical protein
MINRVQRLIRAIRATLGDMLLLLNGLAAPAWLASSEPDFCSISVRLNSPVLIRNANVAEKPHPGWEFFFFWSFSPSRAPLAMRPARVCRTRACLSHPAFVNRACDVCFRAMRVLRVAHAQTGVAAPSTGNKEKI